MLRQTAYHNLSHVAVETDNQANYVTDLSCYPCLDMTDELHCIDDLEYLGSELEKLEEKVKKLREAFNETLEAERLYQLRG